MDGREATEKFKLAKQLYANKRHSEALQVLDELDAAYPNQKNVLYAKPEFSGDLMLFILFHLDK